MKNTLKICALLLAVAIGFSPDTGLAQATCFADYKAKRSSGGALELHYGVIQLSANACQNPNAARAVIARRIQADNWVLLRVVSTFDQSGLGRRQGNAGQYYLRY